MRWFAMVLSFTGALLGCDANDHKKQTQQAENFNCSIRLHRRLCAVPWNFASSSGSACIIRVTVIVQLPYDLDLNVTQFSVNLTMQQGEQDYQINSVFPYNETFNDLTWVHYFSLDLVAEELLKALPALPPTKLEFGIYVCYEEDERCKRCSTTRALDMVYDNAPTVVFKVIVKDKASRVSGASRDDPLVFNGLLHSTTTLMMQSMDDSVVVNIDVQDGDLFVLAQDVFEYSAVGKPSVTLSAFVRFSSEQSFLKDVNSAGFPVQSESKDSDSGNYELVTKWWCEKEYFTSVTSRNTARVQYRFFMTDLLEAVRKLYQQQHRSVTPNLSYAQVVLTLDVSVTSGVNRLAGEGKLTLAFILPFKGSIVRSRHRKFPANFFLPHSDRCDCEYKYSAFVVLSLSAVLILSYALLQYQIYSLLNREVVFDHGE